MSTRNRNSNSNSNSNSNQSTTRSTQTQSTSIRTSRPAQSTPIVQQTSTPAATQTRTTRRSRKPVTIRVRSTGEEIRRVPVERSGYRVVRYGGYYHTVRGGGGTAPYIVGTEDSEDMLGRA